MARYLWKLVEVVLVTSVACLASGCWEPYIAEHAEQPVPISGPLPGVLTARVRLIHASPDAPPVDVYSDTQRTPLLTDVEYGETTPFLNVPIGALHLSVRPTGSSATAAPLFTLDSTHLESDDVVTAVAVGRVDTDDGAQRFRVLLLRETFGAAEPGSARVRIIHGGSDAPMVALDLGDDGTVDVQRLARFGATDPRGLRVPAGRPLQLGVLTGEPRRKVTAFTVPALPEGAQVFLVATGLLSAPSREDAGFALLAANPDTTIGFVRQNPVVYVLHASPDAAPVDVFLGDTELADGLGFGALSGALQVPPGRYTLDLFPHEAGTSRPATAPTATGQTEGLEPGRRYLVTAAGFLAPPPGTQGLTLLTVAEAFPVDASHARLRLVHASPDAARMDGGPLEHGRVPTAAAFDDVDFGMASAPPGVPLPLGPSSLGLTLANAVDRDPLFSFEVDPEPLLGHGLFAVAAGARAPASGQPGLQLLLVDSSASAWTVQALAPR